MKPKNPGGLSLSAALAILPALGGCAGNNEVIDPDSPDLVCSISQNEIFNGGPGKDGIPALTNPEFVRVGQNGLSYLQPEDRVVSENTGYPRDYAEYPYGDYDNPENSSLFFPGEVDRRRPPKERVLGIPVGSGGLAFPFGSLQELGFVAAVHTEILAGPAVVFWDGNKNAAMAYRTELDGESLTLSVIQGKIMDDQTGSVWSVGGLATGGPKEAERLEPVSEAFVAFWFAWPEFYPDIELWSPS
jgi:hypothetical protein